MTLVVAILLFCYYFAWE